MVRSCGRGLLKRVIVFVEASDCVVDFSSTDRLTVSYIYTFPIPAMLFQLLGYSTLPLDGYLH
jgi:hypothetical protein